MNKVVCNDYLVLTVISCWMPIAYCLLSIAYTGTQVRSTVQYAVPYGRQVRDGDGDGDGEGEGKYIYMKPARGPQTMFFGNYCNGIPGLANYEMPSEVCEGKFWGHFQAP